MKKMILAALLLLPMTSFASVDITNLSVNPATVEPGQTATLSFDITTNGSGCNNNWTKTKVIINGVETLLDLPTPDQTVNGNVSTSTEITAPNADGDYEITLQAIGSLEQGLSCNDDEVRGEATTTLSVVSPAPAPVHTPAVVSSAAPSTSIFRKLCNLYSLFGVGFCPAQDFSKGVEYIDLYSSIIASLKSQ